MLKDRKGFTLIELMVVVAILAILATIVASGVTGSGTAGEKSQVVSDASSLKSAVTSYQNAAIDQSWPITKITRDVNNNYVFASGGFNFVAAADKGTDRIIPTAKLVELASSATEEGLTITSAYEFLNWKSRTYVRQKQGGTARARLVPDFLDAPPDSTRLLSSIDSAVAGKMLPEYLWLLKIGSALDADARSVQVFRLDETSLVYERIYPKIQ